MLSKNFDDSVTPQSDKVLSTLSLSDHHGQNQINADGTHEAAKGYFRDEARCACSESKKIAYESLARALAAFVWLGMLGCKC